MVSLGKQPAALLRGRFGGRMTYLKMLLVAGVLAGLSLFLSPLPGFSQEASIGQNMNLIEFNGVVYEKYFNPHERRAARYFLTKSHDGAVEVELTSTRAKLYVGKQLVIEGNVKQGVPGCGNAFRYIEWDAMLDFSEAEQQARARSPWCFKRHTFS